MLYLRRNVSPNTLGFISKEGLFEPNDTERKMSIDLYTCVGSPPCAAVLLTAKIIGVDLNIKDVDLEKGEHLTPEFLKLNPLHTVPTLNDNGLLLHESRVMMTYLVGEYGKNDSLYPKDLKKRALIDQRLYFDISTLYGAFADYYYPVILTGASFDPAKMIKIENAFKFLNTFLEATDYVAGNILTLADLTIATSVAVYEAVSFNMTPYNNVTKWFAKVKAATPAFAETVGKTMQDFKAWAEPSLKK